MVTPAISADIVVITQRDDLLVDLGQILGGRATVRPVENAGDAVELLGRIKGGRVLVIDTRDTADARGELQRVLQDVPEVVALLLVLPAAWKLVVKAVAGLPVQALLPLPLDPADSSLETVLESAIGEALARAATRRSQTPATAKAAAAPAPASPARRKGGLSKPLMLIAAGGILAAGAGAGYYYLSPSSPEPAANAAAPQQIETSLVSAKVDDLLEDARAAMRERRYFLPVGNNALLFYRSAAAADPSNAEARDGLQRVVAVLSSRLDESIAGGRLDEAAFELGSLQQASPADPQLPALTLKVRSAQILKAETEGNIERAAGLIHQAESSGLVPAEQIARWRANLARRQEELKVQQEEANARRLASLIAESLHEGRITDPPGNNAKAYLQQLATAAPASPLTQRAQRDLITACLARARDPARNNAEMERWLAEARQAGAGPAELENTRHEALAARQQAETDSLLAQLRDRLRTGKLTEPAQDSAVYYLGQLQTHEGGQPPVVQQAGRELAAKLLERARGDVARGRNIDGDLQLARRYGADAREVSAVQQLVAAVSVPAPAPTATHAESASSLSPHAEPKRVKYTPPAYPESARRDDVAGHVLVRFTIGLDGEPQDVRVVESSPPGVFEKAVMLAVKRWRYEPAVVDGKPVTTTVQTDVKFGKGGS